MKRAHRKLALTLLLALALTAPALAQQNAAKPAEVKEGVALTVYNGNFAVVREVRKIDIRDGVVYFKDVAQQIDPTTVHFKSLTDPKAVLLEQNYQFDLVSPDKMLQKYLDKPIEVVVGGKDDKPTSYAGTLMSFDNAQLVLKEKDGKIVMIQRVNNVRDIRFSALPEGLLVQPTLVWQVRSDVGGQQMSEVSYQTGGVNWHAEYVLVLNGDDTAADLAGWVSVDNRSGKTYKDAQLKFIAGDVRKIVDNTYGLAGAVSSRGTRMLADNAAPAMVEQAFFEYHMYTLGRRSTVANNEVKQLELFPQASDVKVTKRFLMYPTEQFRWWGSVNMNKSMDVGDKLKAKIFVEFKNSKENQLGMPLPAGKVRAYKRDPVDGAMEFIGEERIDHTPRNETLSLNIGTAFDIIGERKQTAFDIDTNRRIMRETIEITVRNHKKEAIEVRVKENFFRSLTNKVTANSHPDPFKKLDASTASWDLPIPATEEDKPGTVVLTYTVEYTW
ncbi:MAG: hypothetical protein FWE88_02860 [Phycisphaerae bacterium]|nr:hypothetical protein [Phycisphaerae bacterium]